MNARPNPYLKGEQCILCHCYRPHHELSTNRTDDNKSADLSVNQSQSITDSMLQVELYYQ